MSNQPRTGDPLATIIVVTHNSTRWLARQSAALSNQTDMRWRLIVLDNASQAENRPKRSDLPQGAKLIQSDTNLGFAEGNNTAAHGVTTPYLVFLNPDAFPEPAWLGALFDTIERFPEAAAVGSTQLRADEIGVLDGVGDVMHASGIAYRSGYGQQLGAIPPVGETFSTCAAAMLIRREIFEAVGGFDERYFCYFEDVDLGFRLRLQGYRLLQSPDALVAHIGGGSAGTRSAFAEFHGARNRLWTFVKCMPDPLFWLLLPAHLIMSGFFFVIAPLRGRGFDAWNGFRAAIAGLGPIWKERRSLQRARKASVLDIAAALTWSPDIFLTRRPVIRSVTRFEPTARAARPG